MTNKIDKREMLNIRDEYIELIKKELMGPGSEIDIPDSEHELISERPSTRYSVGILFPKTIPMDADDEESLKKEKIESVSEDEFAEEIEAEEILENEQGEENNTGEGSNPGDEENLDEEIGLATQNMPSSMGITFCTAGNIDKLQCKVKFATYRKSNAKDCRVKFYPNEPEIYAVPDFLSDIVYFDKTESTLRLVRGGIKKREITLKKEKDLLVDDEYGIVNCLYKLCDQLNKGWVREPHEVEVQINFKDGDYIDNNKNLNGTDLKITALRRKIADKYSITIMLVNDIEGEDKANNCIFQPQIFVSTSNNDFTFEEYSGSSDNENLDEEEQSLCLQYRNKKVYATGLGTSAKWDINEYGKGELYSEFFPIVEVPQMDFSLPDYANIDDNCTSMKYLSDLNDIEKGEKIEKLKTFIGCYEKWISIQRDMIDSLESKFRKIADKNIIGCEKSYQRMVKGIEILKSDDMAWDAFQLANRAMFMQRVHLKLQDKFSNKDRFPYDEELSAFLDNIDYYTIDRVLEDKYSWRPFQLAFLLMSLESMTNEKCNDRELVDLIWFPTGGGKTEAYLGLTAFTIFYRRLRFPKEADGTTVIMRYTLRLLAAQQFTRASTLICACEYIRVDATSRKPQYKKYALGKETINIGLWIGGEHTPNKNEKAKKELTYLQEASPSNLRDMKDKHNKFQVLKCPWCGTKMVQEVENRKAKGTFGYRISSNHFELFCPQESCFFNQEGKLPIQVVDEELYRNPPTLLFGTVDKFAMLPWKKEVGNFFALNSENRSPELIIQDELHLISGPLGTMVGLYETAISALCENKGVKTKIIASTATIRRAKEQCSALYDREVYQFPSPGLNAEDSFFAREAKIDYESLQYGRKYVGLMPSGKTKAMMEVRTIAALLQKISVMDISDEIKDKFWTLTVYFNSLKDLGKCTTLVDDDIKDFIRRTAYRLGTSKDIRQIGRADELTSRVSTTELNETLDKLEKLEYDFVKIS